MLPAQYSDTSSTMDNLTDLPKFDPATFDEHADLYEEMLSWPYRKELELPTLKLILGDLSGLDVLDFGCGPGNISRWLNTLGAKSITGHDISEGMLNYARRREEKEQLGINYSSDINEKYDEYFDIVLAVYVMPYIATREALLAMSQMIMKILKPGGRLITLPMHPEFNAEPEYYRSIGLRLIEQQPRVDGCRVRLHICKPPYDINIQAYYWSRQTLDSVLYQAGFQRVNWKSLNIPAYPISSELSLYLQCPHAAIIECIKE